MLMLCCFELLDAIAFSFLLVYPLLKEVVSLAVKELILIMAAQTYFTQKLS